MQMWWDKTIFDARYVVGDDLYHRIFEVVWLVVLAAAVVHIRPIEIMSHPSEHVAMFAFAVSVAIGDALSLIRFAEVYFVGVGQRDVMKSAVRKEIGPYLTGMMCHVVAAILAGVQLTNSSNNHYDGDTHEDEDYHRLLAGGGGGEDSDYSSSSSSSTVTHLPIYFTLAATVSRSMIFAIRLWLFFPNDGSHKTFSKFVYAKYTYMVGLVRWVLSHCDTRGVGVLFVFRLPKKRKDTSTLELLTLFVVWFFCFWI